ncbi:GCN5-related N-acetyltransferase [Actinosynnema mirum DSM 43827]|uniref:GCN5-related N-acetyltransferase n=1 Tax=Actinosynnema mirum (strain ATCC 29888 / DSM 43827 / JCM 3225 / NBRC 14064 / NCIMB 13271 / NRRL B-12336 / IMRU 3971 / 101) TaxID=446462 RepID=C6WP39_ACTMD|nr:GCN5-related N-acetyltransferase [Actinosynnema mirum DSM 43827]
MDSARVLIRPERPADVPAIRAVTAAAFTRPDQSAAELRDGAPVEVWLVDELRADAGWLPALSLVAQDPDGAVVGHVLATRGAVGDVPALGLGPLSVRPDRQRAGVGSALVHALLGAADALGEPLVALLGDPGYYHRFGFLPCGETGVAPPVPEWEPHFQVRPLAAHDPAARGTFRYAEPFDRL